MSALIWSHSPDIYILYMHIYWLYYHKCTIIKCSLRCIEFLDRYPYPVILKKKKKKRQDTRACAHIRLLFQRGNLNIFFYLLFFNWMIINFNLQHDHNKYFTGSGWILATDMCTIGETLCVEYRTVYKMYIWTNTNDTKKEKKNISHTKLKYAINFLSIVYIFHRHHHHYLIIDIAVDASDVLLSNAVYTGIGIARFKWKEIDVNDINETHEIHEIIFYFIETFI